MAKAWFLRLSLLGTMLAFCVVVLGAYVRLSDAGLGCPDWPGCYGTLTVPQSEAALQHAQTAFPDKPVETHKAWKEMAHRYLAGTLGLLVLALFILGWRAQQHLKTSPWLTSFLLALIIFQAALGMWTVTLLLKPAVVSAHLIGGMATLGLLTWIAHRHWGRLKAVSARMTFFIRVALVVLLAQIMLGGWTSTNYAALACTDFPTCHGAWVPVMDFKEAFHIFRELGASANGGQLSLPAYTAIQWTHRVGALLIFVYFSMLIIAMLRYRHLRRIAFFLAVALLAQVGLGIANLVHQLPLVLAVAHNAGAALLVVLTVALNSKVSAKPSFFGFKS